MPYRLAVVVHTIVVAPRSLIARSGSHTYVKEEAGEIVVELDGALVSVHVERSALADLGERRTGRWAELSASCDGDFPTGPDFVLPFQHATVDIMTLSVGQPIEIYGEVQAREPADDGGMRQAPSLRISKVRALLVCTGDGREARMSELIAKRYPAEP